MLGPQFTQADLVCVQKASYDLAMLAPKLVAGHPLFAVAALSMAACHAAILTETSYETLAELLKLHFATAEAALAGHDADVPTVPQPKEKA